MFKHQKHMDIDRIRGNVDASAVVRDPCITVGRNIEGFSLSPGIDKVQRLAVESLMKSAFKRLRQNLSGTYYSLAGMSQFTMCTLERVPSGGYFTDVIRGTGRDWPQGRGIYQTEDRSFTVWVNVEDHLKVFATQDTCKGDFVGTFERLVRGIRALEEAIKDESGKDFMLHEKYGYLQSCPTKLGTGMEASLEIELPGWKLEGLPALQKRCEGLKLKSSEMPGGIYDITNKQSLGCSEVQVMQTMIDGVNTLFREDLDLQRKFHQ